jgi:hypothetical protein
MINNFYSVLGGRKLFGTEFIESSKRLNKMYILGNNSNIEQMTNISNV